MSGAEQFTAAVPERSGPRDWRGGLERRGARRGRGLAAVSRRLSVTCNCCGGDYGFRGQSPSGRLA